MVSDGSEIGIIVAATTTGIFAITAVVLLVCIFYKRFTKARQESKNGFRSNTEENIYSSFHLPRDVSKQNVYQTVV